MTEVIADNVPEIGFCVGTLLAPFPNIKSDKAAFAEPAGNLPDDDGDDDGDGPHKTEA